MADSPVTKHGANSEDEATEASVQEQKQMEQAYAQMKRKMSMAEIGRMIKHKVMVLSGKGGVGKSTVSTGLALSLAQQGLKVGILDIDITGPNVPKMMGLEGRRLHVEAGRIHPAQGHLGVKVISMAFLLDNEDTPVVWRGPIKLGAIQQFIADVEWGNLDYLIIDFPPGTSDEPLTVAQSLPDIDGMVIVTTPQDVALLDSRKSITFSESLKVPVLGVVENMSGYTINGKSAPNSDVEIDGPAGKTLKTTADDQGNFAITIDKVEGNQPLKSSEFLSLESCPSIPASFAVATMVCIVLSVNQKAPLLLLSQRLLLPSKSRSLIRMNQAWRLFEASA